ncbi:unnamed protein product [Enterobius vermicularis]|uniref:RRM domain-containing protein n=1 Tax=Enterobius vermicularis TaxID=51028 RepID=A0A0N4UVM5_ENTVE|nr:unnamed protein product [Enterobius vermicularis]
MSERLHTKCRNTAEPYLHSKIYRVEVPDEKVRWSTSWQNYSAPDYTSSTLVGKPYADKEIGVGSFKWNQIDGRVDRRSHQGQYELSKDGRPLNPNGRTGLRGRGVLGKWGPNHAADCIVSRIHDGRLQFIAIERRDRHIWAVPGGMIEPGELAAEAAKREFAEEALWETDPSIVAPLWKKGKELYRGYVDDPRNTDNAWMETVAFNFHDDGGILDKVQFKAGDDAVNVRWLDAAPLKEILYASHADFIELLKENCPKVMSRRPGPPSIDGLFSLKIDNISYQTTPQDLRRLFEKYGEIGDIHIPRDRYTKQSKGFGFVRYYSRRDAEYAMDRMDGRWLDGREVRVAMARYERPIDERNARSGGYRSRRLV